MTKDAIRAIVPWREGGIPAMIIDMGINPVFLPEDTPADVKCAWLRLYNQGRKDVDTIVAWLDSEDTKA